MNLIERLPFRADWQSITLMDRLRGIWTFGLAWDRDLQAQGPLIARLREGLDNRYILMRNIGLPGLGLPVPLILIGPAGLKVICASALRGIYRASDDHWYSLDSRTKHYSLARPNLIKRSFLMAKAVQETLLQRGHRIPDIEPVLFFASAGLHVEAQQAAARLVQRDGIDHFLAGILHSPAIMDSTAAQAIADTILKMESMKTPGQPAGEPRPPGKPAGRERKAGMKTWRWWDLSCWAPQACPEGMNPGF